MEMECNFSQQNEEALVQALKEAYGGVIVTDEPMGLRGYQGDDRSLLSKSDKNWAPKCHIVVPKKYVGGASNDIGFRRNEVGGYDMYVSNYDQHTTLNVMDTVKQKYSAYVTEHTLKSRGYSVTKTTTKDGKIVLKASRWKK